MPDDDYQLDATECELHEAGREKAYFRNRTPMSATPFSCPRTGVDTLSGGRASGEEPVKEAAATTAITRDVHTLSSSWLHSGAASFGTSRRDLGSPDDPLASTRAYDGTLGS